jgi:hypothetical protein
MGNNVTYMGCHACAPLCMNNGLTDVFIHVLSLAASALATTDDEKRFAVWFSGHDQRIHGLGVVDFDLSEMPWVPQNIEDQKAFLRRVIDAASRRYGWDRLDYSPHEEHALAALRHFGQLVDAFRAVDVSRSEKEVWSLSARPLTFEKCAQHQVYLHEQGCILCNEGKFNR